MSELISTMSEAFADTVEAAGQSVLRVEGRRRLPASGIVWSEDGMVITAHHVLERDSDISIGSPEGESIPAKLLGRDPTTDLAVLQIENTSLKPPKWVKPGTHKVGHIVFALGRPGSTVQAALGIISALETKWRTPYGGTAEGFTQSDVVMYPGFSGGPLVNVQGEFLGLNTSALRGASVTIPTTVIKGVVESLVEHGRIRRGYLGVGLQPVRLPSKQSKSIDQEFGLLIVSVEQDSPAENAGIILGDTILALNSTPIKFIDDLMRSLGSDLIDKDAALKILRGGEIMELIVKIGEKV